MKQVRCKGYKNCEYKHRCSHSDIHYIFEGRCCFYFDNVNGDPDNVDCVCVTYNIRKEKLKKIYETR